MSRSPKVGLAVGLVLAAGVGTGVLAAQFEGPDGAAPAARAAAPQVVLARGGKALLPVYVAAGPLAGALLASADASREELDKRAGLLGYRHEVAVREKRLDEAKALAGEIATLKAVREARAWADDLERCLSKMCGGRFDLKVVGALPARPGPGIYVGEAAALGWPDIPRDLAEEELLLRTTRDSQVLVAGGSRHGVSHAVYTLLDRLGCRWFFPGEAWEVIPSRPDIAVALDERQKPDFAVLRTMGYGGGASSKGEADKRDWDRRNRLSPIYQGRDCGHTWFGLDPKRDFQAHPDWFAEVNGKREPTKPCYSHPEVIQKAIAYALAGAASGRRMIPLSAPDGGGFCECARCRAALKGGKERRIQLEGGNLLFTDLPDGQLAGITSETVFSFANEVAEAVARKYPNVLLSCYAYSHYAHPPTFDLHPSIYVPLTTTFRDTPLSFEEQAAAFARKAKHMGIYDYYDVYEWFQDNPYGKDYGTANLEYLVISLNRYRRLGLDGLDAEMSNNWASRGLGTYIAARLLWDVSADTEPLMRDFFERAYGPAARPMESYYAQFYGPPRKISAAETPDLADRPYLEYHKGLKHPSLKRPDNISENSFKWLTQAAALVKDTPEYRARVDQIRMYYHYYFVLRKNLDDAARAGDEQKIIEAVRDETLFAARLLDTNMIHSWVLLGEGFYCRFRKHKALLSKVPEAQLPVWAAGWPQNKDKPAWRRARADVPTHDEMEAIWAADKAALGL